jgi:ribosome maturation factor RimP
MGLDDDLREELRTITDSLGVRVIEVKTYRGKNGLQIHVVIDKYNGVSIGDCGDVTRLFGERLDVLDIVDEGKYTLEVSSPGIGRTFKSKGEYSLFASRKVRVFLKEPLENGSRERTYAGILRGIENDTVTIETPSDTLKIPLDRISKTKLEG